jgi:hypothetical protein
MPNGNADLKSLLQTFGRNVKAMKFKGYYITVKHLDFSVSWF